MFVHYKVLTLIHISGFTAKVELKFSAIVTFMAFVLFYAGHLFSRLTHTQAQCVEAGFHREIGGVFGLWRRSGHGGNILCVG